MSPWHFLSLILLGINSHVPAQWTVTSALSGTRQDDIFFINPDTGWVAGGSNDWIQRTHDGGDSWQTIYNGSDYLRSIEFATPQLGFCGSLSDLFLRTMDGGDTWQDISSLIPPPSSICGLCAPTEQVIYGAGVWSGPGYVIRSTDGGASWTTFDLSSIASALVDVYFLNADTGFAAGRAEPASLGGVILYTEDGGDNWSVRHLTGQLNDYVWKLQSPDGIHIYGSIDASFGIGGTRFVRSNDAGATWETDTAMTAFHYIQAIGFLDSLHGWMGAEYFLLETLDGGNTWQEVPLSMSYGGYDRFHRVNSTEAFMCGYGVYKYGDGSVGSQTPPAPASLEWVEVDPNPVSNEASVMVHLLARSQAEIIMYSVDGHVLRSVHKGPLGEGGTTFTLDVEGDAPGKYIVSLRTNQGQSSTAFVKR